MTYDMTRLMTRDSKRNQESHSVQGPYCSPPLDRAMNKPQLQYIPYVVQTIPPQAAPVSDPLPWDDPRAKDAFRTAAMTDKSQR